MVGKDCSLRFDWVNLTDTHVWYSEIGVVGV